MESDDGVAKDHKHSSTKSATKPRSHLFAVRLWKEGEGTDIEYRGNVRDVVGGAFLNFRDWSELTAFMIAQVEEAGIDLAERIEGEM